MSKASSEKRAKANAHMTNYRAKEESIQFYISRFPDLVSQGPFHICTCCDWLWYKHSVLQANKLRQQNPDIRKYLKGKTSVSVIEWVCTTCYRHLTKNKITPSAVVNGMSFPPKPAFFDLNELECRL